MLPVSMAPGAPRLQQISFTDLGKDLINSSLALRLIGEAHLKSYKPELPAERFTQMVKVKVGHIVLEALLNKKEVDPPDLDTVFTVLNPSDMRCKQIAECLSKDQGYGKWPSVLQDYFMEEAKKLMDSTTSYCSVDPNLSPAHLQIWLEHQQKICSLFLAVMQNHKLFGDYVGLAQRTIRLRHSGSWETAAPLQKDWVQLINMTVRHLTFFARYHVDRES